jgi:hypothetical protein
MVMPPETCGGGLVCLEISDVQAGCKQATLLAVRRKEGTHALKDGRQESEWVGLPTAFQPQVRATCMIRGSNPLQAGIQAKTLLPPEDQTESQSHRLSDSLHNQVWSVGRRLRSNLLSLGQEVLRCRLFADRTHLQGGKRQRGSRGSSALLAGARGGYPYLRFLPSPYPSPSTRAATQQSSKHAQKTSA